MTPVLRSANDLTALIIDDQSTMRSIVRGLLKKIGITNVEEADNGNNGIKLILEKETPPDFVLCDLYMEKGGGLDFLNHMRREEKLKNLHIPVILLTGEQDPLFLEVSRQVGAVGVLHKPCSIADIAEVVGKAVGFDLHVPHVI